MMFPWARPVAMLLVALFAGINSGCRSRPTPHAGVSSAVVPSPSPAPTNAPTRTPTPASTTTTATTPAPGPRLAGTATTNAPTTRTNPPTPVLKSFAADHGRYQFTIDATDAPDLMEWADRELRPVVQAWYPKLIAMLPSDGFVARTNVTLRFRLDMGGTPASAGGGRINMNAPWFRKELKREARGSVVHEMVHVVQDYGGARRRNPNATRTPGWLVEGIPDYIRWFLYEPETKGAEITARNFARARHDASYRVTGNFLNWVTLNHNKEIVPKLNAAAREGRYAEDLWKQFTGQTLTELGDAWRQAHATRLNLPLTNAPGSPVSNTPSPAPAGAAQPEVKSSAVRRILFLGNSITLHGPKPDIGWTNNWGMAASAEDKDYVHLVAQAFARHTSTTPEIRVRNIADFERQYATYPVEEQLKELFAFDPDLVVLAIGENVPALASDAAKAQFQQGVVRILNSALAKRRPMIVVRSCFWPDAAKDQALRAAAAATEARFVDVGDLGRDPTHAARAERTFAHDGVAGHPGDKGMKALSDAIVQAALK